MFLPVSNLSMNSRTREAPFSDVKTTAYLSPPDTTEEVLELHTAAFERPTKGAAYLDNFFV